MFETFLPNKWFSKDTPNINGINNSVLYEVLHEKMKRNFWDKIYWKLQVEFFNYELEKL